MHIRKTAAALALAIAAGASVAHADTIFTVTATYEPLTSANTTVTVKNVSGTTETNVDLFSGGVTEMLGSLAPGASITYAFNENSGPFVTGPGDKGLSDTTGYQVSVGFLGSTVSTSLFSPVANLTGHYVDFLGACYLAEVGCSVDSTVDYPLSGEVAQGLAPVPLPPSLGLLLSGLAGFGLRTFRAFRLRLS